MHSEQLPRRNHQSRNGAKRFFDELNFEPGDTEDNALQSDDVADAVMQLISSADHAVVEEININPLKRVVRKKGD